MSVTKFERIPYILSYKREESLGSRRGDNFISLVGGGITMVVDTSLSLAFSWWFNYFWGFFHDFNQWVLWRIENKKNCNERDMIWLSNEAKMVKK